MMIEVYCECGRSVEVTEDGLLGATVKCPACSKEIRVPTRDEVVGEDTAATSPVRPEKLPSRAPPASAVASPDESTPAIGEETDADRINVVIAAPEPAAQADLQTARAPKAGADPDAELLLKVTDGDDDDEYLVGDDTETDRRQAPPPTDLLPPDFKTGPGERCPLCGRKSKSDDVICEGCGTDLRSGEPPPLKRFAGRRLDGRLIMAGGALLTAAVVGLSGAAIYRAGADGRAVRAGSERLRAGDAPGAEALFREALASNQKNADAHMGLGEALLREGHPGEAADEAHAAEALRGGSDGLALALYGRARLAERRPQEALDALLGAWKMQPEIPSLRHHIAHARFALGASGEAIASYEEALQAEPRSAESPLSQLHLGELYLQKGRLSEAAVELEAAQRAKAPEAETWAAIGDLEAARQRAPEAKKAYQASLAANDKQAWVHFKLARLLWRTQERDAARPELDRARAIDDAPVEFWLLDGTMRAETGDRPGALAAFREAAKRKPKDAEAFVQAARIELQQGEPARAREDLDAALAADPGNVAALSALAELARGQKDWKTAAAALKRAVQQESQDASLRARYAETLEATGQLADAINEYRTAAQLDANADAPRRRIAALLFAAHRPADAALALEELVKIRPDDADAKVALARIRLDEKKFDAAKALLQSVVDKDKANEEANQLLQRVNYEKFRDGK